MNDGTLYFLHSDHLGSATLTTDVSGHRVGEARYTPFGEMRRGYPVGVMSTDRRFTGQRWDGALALYDYRARYYDPSLGRFLQPDPLVPELGNPQSLNRYAYVYNNPLRYTDPSGHCPWCLVIGKVLLQTAVDVGLDFLIARATGTDFNLWTSLQVNAALNVATLGVGSTVAKLRHLGKLATLASHADEIADIARLGARAEDFLKIAHIPGADRLLKKLLSTAAPTVKGAEFELEFALAHADEIEEIGRVLEVIQGGQKEIDFVLKGNVFVNVKNYEWATYSKFVVDKAAIDLAKEAKSFFKYNPSAVKYVFKGSVPDRVRQALEAVGVIVEVIP